MNIISAAGFKNVWVLSISSALAGSTIPLMILAGSLAGTYLAPSAAWATAPIALMITGTAVAAIPVTQLMRTMGRKQGLLAFMMTGIAACGLAIIALQCCHLANQICRNGGRIYRTQLHCGLYGTCQRHYCCLCRA